MSLRLPLFASRRAVFPVAGRQVELLYDDTEVTQDRIHLLRGEQEPRVFVSLLRQHQPGPSTEVYPIGTVVRVVLVGGAFAMAEGEERARLLRVVREPGGPLAEVDPLPSLEPALESVGELMRSIRELFARWAARTGRLPGASNYVRGHFSPSRLAYATAAFGPFTEEERQRVLSQLDPAEQLELVLGGLLRQGG